MEMQELEERVGTLLHERKYAELRALLVELNAADIAALLEEIEEEQLPIVFRLLPKELAAETFVDIDGDMQEVLLRAFSDREIKDMMDELFLDDTVDLIEEMPANVVKRILRQTDPDTRKQINEILNYPKDSAGSIMTIEYVDLKQDMTVEEAFTRIRTTGVDKETIYTCYVTDHDRHLEGLVSVKTLLLSPKESVIGDIMERNVISVNTLEDREDVAHQFEKYDLLALPVVDQESRLVGIITVDDAMDVLQEENTEDIEKMAAIVPSDKSYFRTGVLETWKKRIPWLLLLMISATFTGNIIRSFEDALSSMVVLTAFIPMLMDTGGNAGSQSSVTIIRGLSLGDIEMRDVLRVLWKEVRVAVLCGVTLAAANFVKLMLIDRVTYLVAAVVCLTLVATVFFAKIIGCLLPILAKRIGFDPAVMASPFITTIVDALSLLIYFQIATHLLG